MSAAAKPPPMDADEFLVWAARQPGDTRHELVDGEPLAMAPERVQHADTKGVIYERLRAEIRARRLPCQVLVDGVGVRVGRRTMFVPDVLLRCGGPLDPNQQEVADPLILVEVESPSTRHIDLRRKLAGYFALASVRHYLIISATDRSVTHHERRADGVIVTHLRGDGPVPLDPPGIVLDGVFAEPEA